jgi:putative oxidoreductase
MNGLLKVLNLSFIPNSSDLGLLLLRAALGGGMLALHGWKKLELLLGWGDWARPAKGMTMEALTRMRYAEIGKFSDPLGISGTYSLVATTFAEAVCSGLLIIGFCTRFAATTLAFAMGVAFFVVHKGALSGAGSGELAAAYFVGFVALFIAGPGKFSFDGSGSAEE